MRQQLKPCRRPNKLTWLRSRLGKGPGKPVLAGILLAGIVQWPAVALADTLTLQSKVEQTPLLELYTSEGCSSCPPADRYLASLAQTPGLWQDVVPVAFHVTYWNYLGWQDPFAAVAFDRRQRALASREHSGVYTPGVFLAGREWRNWRRDRSLPQRTEAAGVLSARVSCDRIEAEFAPVPEGQGPSVKAGLPSHLEIAWLTRNASSRVLRGENRGRTLSHGFVARSHQRLALARDASGEEYRVSGATACGQRAEPGTGANALAVAIWVSDAAGRPLQAVGGAWPPAATAAAAAEGP